jgi:hypothetical protein
VEGPEGQEGNPGAVGGRKKLAKKTEKKKDPMRRMIPVCVCIYQLEPDPEEWRALPAGPVRLFRERVDNTVGRRSKTETGAGPSGAPEGPDWMKIAKHLRD